MLSFSPRSTGFTLAAAGLLFGGVLLYNLSPGHNSSILTAQAPSTCTLAQITGENYWYWCSPPIASPPSHCHRVPPYNLQRQLYLCRGPWAGGGASSGGMDECNRQLAMIGSCQHPSVAACLSKVREHCPPSSMVPPARCCAVASTCGKPMGSAEAQTLCGGASSSSGGRSSLDGGGYCCWPSDAMGAPGFCGGSISQTECQSRSQAMTAGVWFGNDKAACELSAQRTDGFACAASSSGSSQPPAEGFCCFAPGSGQACIATTFASCHADDGAVFYAGLSADVYNTCKTEACAVGGGSSSRSTASGGSSRSSAASRRYCCGYNLLAPGIAGAPPQCFADIGFPISCVSQSRYDSVAACECPPSSAASSASLASQTSSASQSSHSIIRDPFSPGSSASSPSAASSVSSVASVSNLGLLAHWPFDNLGGGGGSGGSTGSAGSSGGGGVSCTDSDTGGAISGFVDYDIYIKGTLTTSDGRSLTDTCDGESIMEHMCMQTFAGGAYSIRTVRYSCPEGACANGACSVIPSCTDTDPENNPLVFGRVRWGRNPEMVDECNEFYTHSPNAVYEKYCEFSPLPDGSGRQMPRTKALVKACPSGMSCSGGMCIRRTTLSTLRAALTNFFRGSTLLGQTGGGGGMAIPDVSGNNNHGTAFGATPVAGGCLRFDGIDDYVTVPNFDSAPFTFAGWAKKENPGQAYPPLMVSEQSDGWGIGYVKGMGSTTENTSFPQNFAPVGPARVFLSKTQGRFFRYTPGDVSDNAFHHLAVTFDGSTVQFYIDGQLASTQAWTETFASGGNYLLGLRRSTAGHPATGQEYVSAFKGIVDDFRVYSRILSAAEVAALASITPCQITQSSASSVSSIGRRRYCCGRRVGLPDSFSCDLEMTPNFVCDVDNLRYDSVDECLLNNDLCSGSSSSSFPPSSPSSGSPSSSSSRSSSSQHTDSSRPSSSSSLSSVSSGSPSSSSSSRSSIEPLGIACCNPPTGQCRMRAMCSLWEIEYDTLAQCNASCGSSSRSSISSVPATHTYCNAEKQCKIMSGPGTNQCNSDADCNRTQHLECFNNTCRLHAGAGRDLCANDGDCAAAHTVCLSQRCAREAGAGSNQCNTDADCRRETHLACVASGCKETSGAGANLCVKDADCVYTHTVCRLNRCEQRAAVGIAECSTDADCSPQSSSRRSSSLSSSRPFSSPPPPPQCSDTRDNDGDGKIDAQDPGCHADGNPANTASYDPHRNSEAEAQCSDTRDNDGDGKIDAQDPGCHADGNPTNASSYDPRRNSERDPLPPPPPPPSPSLCGNGILNSPEECDDGNRKDFDGCARDCKFERGACGDGILQSLAGEQCDPPLVAPDHPFFCGPDCRWVSRFCGDGVLNEGEQCDDGRGNSDLPNARCRKVCGLGRCGDGILDDQTEECDDGKRLPGDGCDRFCRLEEPFPSFPSLSPLPTLHTEPSPSSLPPTMPSGERPAVSGELPASSLQPIAPAQPRTGPELLAVMAAGAAGGFAWMRRKRSCYNR